MDTETQSVGFTMGLLFWPIIGTIVVIFQAKRLRDPERSRFATMALLLWALSLILLTGTPHIISESIEAVSRRMLFVYLCLGWFGLQLVSFVCAGLGLSQTVGDGAQYEGKGAAIWAICLGLLMSLGFGFNLNNGVRQVIFEHQNYAAQLGLLPEPETASSLRELSAKAKMGSKSTGGPYIAFEDKNFQLQLPNEKWVKFDGSKINPDVTAWFQNRSERMNLMVVAEPLGMEFDDLSPFEEVIRTTFETEFSSLEMSDFRDRKVGGRIVRQMDVSGAIAINQFDYRVHVFMENGVLYQVNVFGVGRDSLSGKDELVDELVGGFSLLDESFYPGIDKSLRMLALSEPRIGLEIELPGKNWMEWEDMHDDAPFLLNGAVLFQSGVVGVTAMWGAEPDEMAAVTVSALLHANDTTYNNLENVEIRDMEVSGYPAKLYFFSDERDGGLIDYCISVFQVDELAIGVIGWWMDDGSKLTVLEAMEGIRIDPAQIVDDYKGDDHWAEKQADMLNGAGLAHYRASRYINSMDYFRKAYERNPKMVVALTNVAHAAYNADDYREAIEYIKLHFDKHSDDEELAVAYGLILAESGQFEEAFQIAVSPFKSGYVEDDDLLALINLFIDADEYDHAVELTRSSFENAPSVKRESWLASVLRISGDYDGAQAWLDEVQTRYGSHELIAEEQAEIFVDRGDYREALDAIDNWVEEHGASVDAADLKVTAQINLGWLADAKTTITEALDEFPGDEQLLDSQRWILSRIGEDDLNLVREPIEPLNVPEEVAKVIAAAIERAAPADWNEKSSIYDYRVNGYEFDPEKQLKRGYKARAQMLDRSAMEDFGTLSFEFDRSYERLYINYIRVLDSEGAVVWEQARESFYISENSDDDMATDSVTLYAPVASLEVGSYLEWECTWLSNGTEDEFPFKTHVFANTSPVKNRTVYLLGDVDGVAKQVADVASLKESRDDLIGWSVDDMEKFHWERYMPELTSFMPHIHLSDADGDWDTLVAEYYSDIEEFIEPDEVIKEIVAGVELSGLDTAEKVTKLIRLIQDQVVYKALEFGSRGVIPEKASATWKNRYGDCKDQTILMLQMLLAAGIESHPFLISTDDELVEGMPSMDQFNHMILYVPELKEQPFLDVVDANFDFAYGAPSGLGGRRGLVLMPEGGRIQQIPEYEFSTENPVAYVRTELTRDPSEEGKLVVSEALELRGYYAMWMRNYFLDIDRDRHASEIKDYVNQYLPNQGVFKRAEIENLDSINETLKVSITYTLPAESESESQEFRPLWEQYYIDMQPIPDRLNPYKLFYPFVLESDVVFAADSFSVEFKESEAPGGAEVKPLKFNRLQEGLDEVAASTKAGFDTVSKVLIGWPNQVMEADEYRVFHQTLNMMEESSSRRIRMKPKEAAEKARNENSHLAGAL